MDSAGSSVPHSQTIPARDRAPIIVRNLNHWFGQGEARKQALFDVNLTLEPGQLTILLGASGSGKTTLLTLMGCLRRVQEGSVTLLGTELRGADEDVLVQCRRRLGLSSRPITCTRA
jgi:putative ABC transport system ATP-binding protein